MVADTSENKAHKVACAASEQTRMAAVEAALALQRAGGSSITAAATIKLAEQQHYQRIVTSALANGVANVADFAQAAAWVGTHA
jgi:hypothetical protein